MKPKGMFILLAVLCFGFSLFSQDVSQIISQSDGLFNQMEDMKTAKEVESLLLKAIGVSGGDYDAFWRMARILYYIGDHTQEKKERRTLFSRGVYYAEKAMELEPDKPDGYYWFGVDNGMYGETRGVLKSLSLVKPIKNAMNKVIELDRSYEEGGADRVLGRVYHKLPGFAGGSKEKSLEHLLKSLEYGPDDALTHLYLAETYLDMKEKEKAREQLEFILNLPPDDRWTDGVGKVKELAKELLNSKKFKD
jgi:tetratricopeptide (TPR) repeat protein